MKSLKELLLEKLENINAVQIAAEEYINANYNFEGELTYENINGICVVNSDDNVSVKNKEIAKLTDGFVWGEVKGDFRCNSCKNLKTLEGAPEEVKGSFICRNCPNIKSLEGAPEHVGAIFDCSECENLESLEGAPKYVGRSFICNSCDKLKSLEGAPQNAYKIKCDTLLK